MSYSLATVLVVTFVTTTLAIYYWRRSNGLYSLLVEGANRFEEMRQRNANLEHALARAEERFKQHRDSQARLERAVTDARENIGELMRKVETKENETRIISDKLELQKGHLEKQLFKAEAQIASFSATRSTLEAQVRDARQAASAATEELSLKERDWRLRQQEFEREKSTFEKRGKTVDPVELNRLKRKLAQYDRLYASMKGMREMTEERNRNWEVALRKLATWIIKETSTTSVDMSGREIGPMVSQALTAIGAQLIDDSDLHAGAQSAADDLQHALDGADLNAFSEPESEEAT